jgi:hypothetical protein
MRDIHNVYSNFKLVHLVGGGQVMFVSNQRGNVTAPESHNPAGVAQLAVWHSEGWQK